MNKLLLNGYDKEDEYVASGRYREKQLTIELIDKILSIYHKINISIIKGV